MGETKYDPLKSWWVDIRDVQEAVLAHDTFAASGGFDGWRKLFADNAAEIAKFFYDNFSSHFPPSKRGEPAEGHDLMSLQLLFSKVSKADFKSHYETYGSRVFAPWTNWFLGRWDNGTSRALQYHIWDNTISYAGRYLQPVTQSETGFAYSNKPGGEKLQAENYSLKGTLAKLKKENKTDVAVDVLSKDYGITGWVTKLQQSPVVELGHIGYLIDDTHLIWIAQDTAKATNTWHLFYERGDQTSRARRYNVDGVNFRYQAAPVMGKKFETLSTSGAKGFIRFTCQKPYSAGAEASNQNCD